MSKKKTLNFRGEKKKELEELKDSYLEEEINQLKLEKNLEKNLLYIKGIFNKVDDLVIKKIVIGEENKLEAALIYINDIVEEKMINTTVLKELMIDSRNTELKEHRTVKKMQKLIQNSLLSVGEVKTVGKFNELIDKLVSGYAVLLLDNSTEGLAMDVLAERGRTVVDPETETVVRGPKEGFVENYEVNLNLIRRRIKTSNLKFELFTLGRVSKTNVVIAYIEGIAEPELVKEVKERINRIDVDIINEGGEIEQLIEDNPFSPFPQMNNTERPDGVAKPLNNGQVAIIVDGTPFVLLAPVVFTNFLRSDEDDYERFLFPTMVRILRFIAFWITLLAPSVYIAITTYHQEMIPTSLLVTIAASRTGVPFPALIEALLMEVTFEALREAGLRLPKQIGQAVSIVGALVIGEAAVQAGLVSQAMVIVVALTGVASFIIPAYNLGIGVRVIRFPIMLLAGSLGIFGITFAILALIIHLAGLRSFGVPYLSPFTPIDWAGLKDSIIKVPNWLNDKRPGFITNHNRRRINPDSKPTPPEENEND